MLPNTFIHRKNKEGEAVIDGNPIFTKANFHKFEGRRTCCNGTATGGGPTVDGDHRLEVTSLAFKWKDDEEKGKEEPFLDATIVGWNLRDTMDKSRY